MNICSNQIKEVILHRFKVNSLQKLLIHINFLLAFIVLFCSHSAFGQSGQPVQLYIVDVFVDDKAVDLGLNVYWAKYNVGVTNKDPNGYGNYFTWYAASKWSDSDWQHWRTPTNQEFNDLYTNTNRSINNYICTFVNKNDNSKSIILPPAGGIEPKFGILEFKSKMGYYWTSDSHSDSKGYRFKFDCCSWYLSQDWRKTYQLSIRPVIKKVTIILKTADGNTTITKSYPYGSKIQIGAFMDECHRVAYWTKSSNSSPETITDIQGDNGCKEIIIKEDATYTAIFEKKKYSVSAYIKNGDSNAEYSSKVGNLECGQDTTISVPIDNCYVFQGWEGPGITGRLAAGQEADGYSCQVDNSVSPTQASLTIPNIDSNTQLNRDYTAIFSIKTTNIRATTDSNKGWVGLNVWK